MNAGRPGHEPGHRPLRGIPRSRAFWELKAEQMMNRLFEPDETLDLHDPAPPPEAARPQALPSPHQAPRTPARRERTSPAAPAAKPTTPLRASLREQPWLLAAALGARIWHAARRTRTRAVLRGADPAAAAGGMVTARECRRRCRGRVG